MQEYISSVANLENCQKCNLCADVCPMLKANPSYPGPKNAGPDGERYRIKDPAFFDNALKYCLNCKRCEVACPSGVRVGDMIARARLDAGLSSSHPLRDKMLASTDFVGHLATPFAPVVNGVLGLGITKAVLDGTMGITRKRTFPKYRFGKFENWLKKNARAQEAFPKSVSYFHGCYANYNYPQLGKDLVTILNACGYGVKPLKKEQCCGVALIANGYEKQAKKQASVNLQSIKAAPGPVLVTSSTCAFTMRDEYAHVLGLDNSVQRDKITMATAWLYRMVESGEIKLAFRDDVRMKAAYHTACHMQRMGGQVYSIGLLRMIPGLELEVLEQNCCGISGTFGFKKENYDLSMSIGSKLFDSIRESDPEFVVTDCETCKWQIEHAAGLEVLNPISLIAKCLDIEKTQKLNG